MIVVQQRVGERWKCAIGFRSSRGLARLGSWPRRISWLLPLLPISARLPQASPLHPFRPTNLWDWHCLGEGERQSRCYWPLNPTLLQERKYNEPKRYKKMRKPTKTLRTPSVRRGFGGVSLCCASLCGA